MTIVVDWVVKPHRNQTITISHLIISFIPECVVFHNLPANVSINEDYDQLKELLSISADCTYSTANFRCIRTAPTCPIITNSTVSCTECSITSNPDPTLFYIDSKSIKIMKIIIVIIIIIIIII